MKVAHFYHVFAAGHWRVPAGEHCRLLVNAGYAGEVHLGLAGSQEQCAQVEHEVSKFFPDVTVAARQDAGYEEVTLRALRAWCRDNPSGRVLYTHAKGAWNPHPLNDSWRRGLDGRLIPGWRDRVEELGSLDLIGSHWITPQAFAYRGVTASFFGGNFWWADAGYIAGLPDLPDLTFETRGLAEAWAGQDNPAVRDLCPGWPAYSY